MRRRFARLAGVFTLALLVGCGAQAETSNVNLAPAGQRAAATASAPLIGARAAAQVRQAGSANPATASEPWWQQLLDAPRKAEILGTTTARPDLSQWWRDVTRDLARQLQPGGQHVPKLPRSD